MENISVIPNTGNPLENPLIKKAIKALQDKKAMEQQAASIVAAPNIVKEQIKSGMQAPEQPMNVVNPIQQPAQVVPNNPFQPQINDEYRGDVTHSYSSNNPDYTTQTDVDNKVLLQNPSIKTAIQPAVINPKTAKDFYKLPKDKQELMKQELADAGHWDVNEKFDAQKALNSFYANQNPEVIKGASKESTTTKTTTEELAQPDYDKYVEETGLNPLMQYIENLKPEPRTADEERLKKIAAVNSIGEGLRLIGDAAYGNYGSIGANIPKRDGKWSLKALDDLKNMKDKYAADNKEWGLMKLKQLIDNRNQWLANKSKKETLEATLKSKEADRLARAAEGDKNRRNAMDIAKYKGGIAQRIAAARASAGGGKDTRPTLLHKQSNKVIKIDPSYFNDILANILATKQANGQSDEVNAILSSMQKDPSQQKAKALVQEHWTEYYDPNSDYSGIVPKKQVQDKQFIGVNEWQGKMADQYNAKTAIRNILSSDLDNETKANTAMQAIMDSYDVNEEEAMKVLEGLEF